jgi:protein-tyrosine phosphatase
MIMLWPALALAIVAGAYAGQGPAGLGKGELAARWLLYPYRWVAGLSATYFNSQGAAYAEVQPGLYFGRMLSAGEAARLDVEAVLDLTAEFEENQVFLDKVYRCIPILDLTPPHPQQLRLAVEFIRAHPNCYVHCALGLGRSAAVMVAFLMCQGMDVEEAMTRVSLLRPRVKLAPASLESLQDFNSPSSGTER